MATPGIVKKRSREAFPPGFSCRRHDGWRWQAPPQAACPGALSPSTRTNIIKHLRTRNAVAQRAEQMRDIRVGVAFDVLNIVSGTASGLFNSYA